MNTETPGASITPRMPGASSWALIALILLAYLIQLLHARTITSPDIDALSKAGNIGYLTLTSEPWRLVTSMFMHGDWLHLLMNLAVLAYVGPLAEAVFGGRGSLAVFLAGGLLAGLASAIGGVAMAEQVNILGQVRYNLIVGVGASGAVMALCGALFASKPGARPSRGNQVEVSAGFRVVIAFLFSEAGGRGERQRSLNFSRSVARPS